MRPRRHRRRFHPNRCARRSARFVVGKIPPAGRKTPLTAVGTSPVGFRSPPGKRGTPAAAPSAAKPARRKPVPARGTAASEPSRPTARSRAPIARSRAPAARSDTSRAGRRTRRARSGTPAVGFAASRARHRHCARAREPRVNRRPDPGREVRNLAGGPPDLAAGVAARPARLDALPRRGSRPCVQAAEPRHWSSRACGAGPDRGARRRELRGRGSRLAGRTAGPCRLT